MMRVSIDAAINTWAVETGKADGNAVDLDAAAQYTKLGVISASDILGNSWVIGNVGANQIRYRRRPTMPWLM